VIDIDAIAHELLAAESAATPIEFLTTRYPEMTWDTARSIATTTDALRVDRGEVQIGWKLGWTSAAMRSALGIDHPNWGTLWQHQISDETLSLDRFIHPKLEPEFVWRAGADLAGGDISVADVHRAGGEWAVGIEVVDPRFMSYDFEALDNTADNSSSAAVRIGDFVTVDPASTLTTRQVLLSDGKEKRSGVGGQAMGSPPEAVAWLARSLSRAGLALQEGELVFTGGLTAPFDATRCRTYEVDAEQMPGARLTFL